MLSFLLMHIFTNIMQEISTIFRAFHMPKKFVYHFIMQNLVNIQFFIRIRIKFMKKLDPKLANVYREMFVKEQALPPGIHFFVNIASLTSRIFNEYTNDS